jgi:hypothetical protein
VSDRFTVDTSEVAQLAADLGEVAASAGGLVRKALEVSARNIKDHWRDGLPSAGHAKRLRNAVTYDLKSAALSGATVLEAEIGPDKDRKQGALGNLIEFGSINNPPQGQGQAALEANQDDFEKGLNMALETAERHLRWGL